MLKVLSSTADCIDFVSELNSDPNFSVPVYSDTSELIQSLLKAPEKPNKLVLGYFEDEALLGLSMFLAEKSEEYLEMLVALSRSAQAYEELFAFLKDNYPGWQCDLTYNPHNHLLHSLLEQSGAEFDPEQQKMMLTGAVPYEIDPRIELYSPKYRDGYTAIHSTDVYWTAEKVIAAPDRFRIILAVEQGEVVGYIDVTHNYDENEPFDVFVKERHRRKGYGRAMLMRAIELNRPKAMILTVNVDNLPAIAMYESLGFTRVDGQNNVVAHLTV